MPKNSEKDINAVKGIGEKVTKDSDAKKKKDNENEMSDSSYILYDKTDENQDDEGEGLDELM